MCSGRTLQSDQGSRERERVRPTIPHLSFGPSHLRRHASHPNIHLLPPPIPHDAITPPPISSNRHIHPPSIRPPRSPQFRRNEETTQTQHPQKPRLCLELQSSETLPPNTSIPRRRRRTSHRTIFRIFCFMVYQYRVS